MSELEFLVADPSHPAWRSPLGRALRDAPSGVRDVTAQADADTVRPLGPAAGVAGIELHAPFADTVLRRLTDLDLDRLPALGPVAHVRALVTREGDDRFRIWFPQEYADYVAEVVIDTWKGVAGGSAG